MTCYDIHIIALCALDMMGSKKVRMIFITVLAKNIEREILYLKYRRYVT